MIKDSFSLTELNGRVKEAIKDYLSDTYWLRAETSDVRRNRNGHCYLEFIEKDVAADSIIAKARGIIWSNHYEHLFQVFENETGQKFDSGLNVLVRVSVEFHQLYGYSLTVVDIDPSFTLGEIARHRQKVLKRLEDEGVLNINKELQMPELANRIAVISSPTAAGYEDFIVHLKNNPNGFFFYTKLFPAIMQGDQSEFSLIAALEEVYLQRELFDAVAIIRGGGASVDLHCFDSYLLANNVAQFPLPVVSGIGHERDVTVIDAVSHRRAKTPTAVAELFISHLNITASELYDLQTRLIAESERRVSKERNDLQSISREVIHQSRLRLHKEGVGLEQASVKMRYQTGQLMQSHRHYLESREQFISMVSPKNILKRGYTLTMKKGKIVTSVQYLEAGETIETYFRDGISISKIESSKVNKDETKI